MRLQVELNRIQWNFTYQCSLESLDAKSLIQLVCCTFVLLSFNLISVEIGFIVHGLSVSPTQYVRQQLVLVIKSNQSRLSNGIHIRTNKLSFVFFYTWVVSPTNRFGIGSLTQNQIILQKHTNLLLSWREENASRSFFLS